MKPTKLLGPYKTSGDHLAFVGNRRYKPIKEVRKMRPPKLADRHTLLRDDSEKWTALIKIWDEIFRLSAAFMKREGTFLIDLPITTRMISSPGALTGTIPSDVEPFRVRFFDKETYLTQSSQLYLEIALLDPEIKKVFCWEKSFRKERADFRHLPEFTHIEFEAKIDFIKNIRIQEKYVKFILGNVIESLRREVMFFIGVENMKELEKMTQKRNFETIGFYEAFPLLFQKTGSKKYKKPSIKNFGVYEEVLLTEIIGAPVFVMNYIANEVAFYHATLPNSDMARNADLLFPGYGEVIGSGERVHTEKEVIEKAKRFRLNMEDYRPYIESRSGTLEVHSGWGMGIERFVQFILKLPFIWETKPFPRVDGQNYP